MKIWHRILCWLGRHNWHYGGVSYTHRAHPLVALGTITTTPGRLCTRCRRRQVWDPANGWSDKKRPSTTTGDKT